ncbi:MAG: hypothetical protein PVI43_00775 [Candidatus Bathyarchaeota archaeon]|jgi:hypothetical protein
MSLSKESMRIICNGLKARTRHDSIAKLAGCDKGTVSRISRSSSRIIFLNDTHCGNNTGLTPPAYQYKYIDNPKSEDQRIRNKWHRVQKECWSWYIKTLKSLQPFDKCFILGDMIDGDGARCGGTEHVVSDRTVQVSMAYECVKQVKTKYFNMVFGTPYHTGNQEDFEIILAEKLNCKIGGHEWESVNGCTFDLKHKQGNTMNPATSLYNEIRDHREWAAVNEQPKADVIVRAHTHRFCIYEVEDTIAISLPALQAYGTKFGARQCSRKVQFGLVAVDVWPDGSITPHVRIAQLSCHKTKTN